MSHHKYLDKDGNPIMIVSSSVPGVTIVPPGCKREDAVPITDEEAKENRTKIVEKIEQNPPIDKVALLTEKVDLLQTEVDKLKQKDGDVQK